MAVIGIDLGTTNSLVAVWKDGKSTLIPNSFGEFLTPSVVSIDDNNNAIVGKLAKERLISHPQDTAEHFKRYMGSKKDIILKNKKFRPEELSALVIRQLCADAQAFLNEPVTEAIISVPAYFDDEQRYATKLAGKLAGIYVERIINEPSSAALAYQAKENLEGMYLVFDFGGGTLDISIVDMFDNIIDIIAIAGDNRLGGQDIDEIIVNTFLEENPVLKTILSDTEKASLSRLAEECKIALTKLKQVLFIYKKDEQTYTMELTNQKLSKICTPILVRMREVIHRALQDTGKSIAMLEGVIPVGGSCIMPLVREYIEYITRITPLEGIDPNLAVAEGVGVVAGIKTRQDGAKDYILSDNCPFSLGVSSRLGDYNNDYFSIIIPRNMPLPASIENTFHTVSENQQVINFKIYQGESPVASQNNLLGTLEIKTPPLPSGKATANVRFTYDINGILEVDILCPQNGNQIHTVVVKNKNLSETEIEKK